MAHRGSAYWRGPDADALQAEYRALVAGDAGAAPAPGDWRATPAEARKNLPPALVAAWDAEPDGFNVRLRWLQDALMTVVSDIGEADAANAFLAGFDALPVGVRVAVMHEAAAPVPGFVRPADAKLIAAFRTLYGGREMIAAWGTRARRAVGLACHRYQRVTAALSPTIVLRS